MKSYIDIQVLSAGDKVLFDRSIPDLNLSFILGFGQVIETLHFLFPNCVVVIKSSVPKSV